MSDVHEWLRNSMPEYAEVIFRAEEVESWVLNSEEFQRTLDILHQNLCRHSHNLDEQSVCRLKLVLAFTGFPFFLRILQDLQHKNEELLLRLLQDSLPEQARRDAIDNTVAVRVRYLTALGVCRRVFSGERISRVIAAMGRTES